MEQEFVSTKNGDSCIVMSILSLTKSMSRSVGSNLFDVKLFREKEAGLFYLPSLEPDAGVERGVVEHSRVHERHRKVRHARQFDNTVNLEQKS